MNVDNLIKQLKSSNLYAECTCGEEFKLSSAILFDGLCKFPDIAEKKRQELILEMNNRIEELKKRKLYADIGAEKKAIEVGIGKTLEKVLPLHTEFKIPIPDCRVLFEPIDMMVFNGLSKDKIESLTFLEIKTGKSRLNDHQKMIKEAVEEKKVEFKVI